MSGVLRKDDNGYPVMGGVSSSDSSVVLNAKISPITGRLLTDSASGSGTVTDVSVVSANGFAGSVATSTTTPAITITTTVTGILSGNGTAVSAASTTGSGSVVLATSPSLTTPAIGVATGTSLSVSGVLASATSLTLEETGAGTDIITIQAPASIVASYTLTLPVNDGNASELLSTDGSGVLSWVAAPAASLVVGTTTIASGTTTRILYDNAGTLGEYTITGTGTVVAMATAPTFVTSIATPAVLATANDSGALGASGTAFADLFLASGAVINFLAGDVTITHSSGILTVAGSGAGDLRITTAGTNAASVVTVGGTQTLTNKSLSLGQVTGLGTNVATALAINVDSAGAFVVNGGALGTPSSGTVTNLTGTASININGTVGATTPTTGVFTTLVAGSTTSLLLGTAGSAVGNIGFRNATSGTITLAPVTGALGTVTLTLPARTDTLVTLGGTEVLTAKTLTNPAINAGTLNGIFTLTESTSIDLDPGQADQTWSGITRTGTAGAALAFGQLCYLAVADSRWELADADALATAGNVLLGMCVLAAAADGNATRMLLYGNIQAASQFPAMTVGAGVYVGETAGAVQVAIPTGADNIIRVVGFATTADELMFNPSQDWQVTVA